MGQRPIFGNSNRFTIHKDLSKNWDGTKNIGDKVYSVSLFADKKGATDEDKKFTAQEQEVIDGFANWCARNEVNLNFSLQEKTSNGYEKRAGCTLFSNGE